MEHKWFCLLLGRICRHNPWVKKNMNWCNNPQSMMLLDSIDRVREGEFIWTLEACKFNSDTISCYLSRLTVEPRVFNPCSPIYAAFTCNSSFIELHILLEWSKVILYNVIYPKFNLINNRWILFTNLASLQIPSRLKMFKPFSSFSLFYCQDCSSVIT